MSTKATQEQRRTTAADFDSANPVLDPGEFAFETDTRVYKFGDGINTWRDIVTPYLAAKNFQNVGDLVTYGWLPTQLLDNNAFATDANHDGMADGWTVVGALSNLSIVAGHQKMFAPASAGASVKISRTVQIRKHQAFSFKLDFVLNTIGANVATNGVLIDVHLDYYTDATLATRTTEFGTNVGLVNFVGLTTGARSIVSQISAAGLSVDTTCVVTIAVYGGTIATLTNVSFKTGKIKPVPLTTDNAVPGSSLYVDADGYLQWSNVSDAAAMGPYIKNTDMVATYKTKAAAATIHSQFLAATDAASTYETKLNASIAHALHQYSADAVANYHTPTSLAAAGFESKDLVIVKTTDHTVTNTTTYDPDSELTFAMVANGSYIFEIFLIVTGATAFGMRISMQSATSASNVWGVHAPVPGGNNVQGAVHQAVSTSTGSTAGTQSIGLDGTTPLFATVRGSVFNGTSAGSMTLALAQNSAAAGTSCTIKADSYMRVMRVS